MMYYRAFCNKIVAAATKLVCQYWRQLLWITVWLSLVVLFYAVIQNSDLHAKEVIVHIFEAMTTAWWAPLAILGAYIIRPLLFIPVTLFALANGLFFGIWIGVPIALCGAVISALTAYSIGRFLRGWSKHTKDSHEVSSTFSQRLLKQRPFEVILSLHLTMLPFDLVNYSAGAMRIQIPSFAMGVLIGMIPGSISMVSIGAGIDLERFLIEGFSVSIIDWRYMLFAVGVFLSATSISHLYRRKHNK